MVAMSAIKVEEVSEQSETRIVRLTTDGIEEALREWMISKLHPDFTKETIEVEVEGGHLPSAVIVARWLTESRSTSETADALKFGVSLDGM